MNNYMDAQMKDYTHAHTRVWLGHTIVPQCIAQREPEQLSHSCKKFKFKLQEDPVRSWKTVSNLWKNITVAFPDSQFD